MISTENVGPKPGEILHLGLTLFGIVSISFGFGFLLIWTKRSVLRALNDSLRLRRQVVPRYILHLITAVCMPAYTLMLVSAYGAELQWIDILPPTLITPVEAMMFYVTCCQTHRSEVSLDFIRVLIRTPAVLWAIVLYRADVLGYLYALPFYWELLALVIIYEEWLISLPNLCLLARLP